ncbi:AraC family transcriptional regulator [Mesorhizobium sp. M0621]|uniref:AraC family transcriptional regulator n=1 Tax=Mesorhizobium sp. M0621 TaxID=2956974 RepID=UPI00333C0A46
MAKIAEQATKTTFSSDMLPSTLDEDARLKKWQDLWTAKMGPCDIKHTHDLPLRFRADLLRIDSIIVADVEATTSRFSRTSGQAASHSQDYLCLDFNRTPSDVWVRHRNRELTVTAGDAVIWANTLAFERRSAAGVAGSMIYVQRPELCALVPNAEDLIARPLDPTTPALRHLQSYADFVVKSGEIAAEPGLGARAADMVLDLFALALGARSDVAEVAQARGLRAARLNVIVKEIERGFAEPGFSSEQVAQRFGLSRRYVNELLAESGQTLEQRVTSLRLRKAFDMLTSPQFDKLKISEIALAAGFNDISYFNRAFRRTFGLSPTQSRGK